MQPELKNLKIGIIGAGYAGASTAQAFLHAGFTNITVFEQARQTTEVGAGIGLRPSSMAAFKEWGILDAITKVSSPSPRFDIVTPTGDVIASMEWPEKEAFGITTHLIHRADFIEALVGALPAGMVKLNHKLASITDNGNSATVTFENGFSDSFDLVVGADGIKSVVRETLFGHYPPVPAFEHTYRAVVDIDKLGGLVEDDTFRMYINQGAAKIYLLPLRHRGQVSFDLSYPNNDTTWSPAITNEQMVQIMEGFEPRLVNLVRNIDVSTVNTRAAHDIDPVQNWNTDCITIIGDAAHAMLYHQGQGANSAILDARELGRALGAATSVKEALAEYVNVRKPIAQELQRISRQSWDAGAVDDVFPGQHEGQAASTLGD